MASNRWAGEVPIVGVAWNGSEEAMAAFVERHGLTMPNLRDAQGEVFARFSVPYQPAWAFVSADGATQVTLGALSDEQLDAALGALLEP